MSEISERLYAAIIESRYSYGELSKLTGIPKSAIQRYATGETDKIPVDRLQALAGVLGVTAEHILGWEDEKIPTDDPVYKMFEIEGVHRRLCELFDRADEYDRETIWHILSRYEEKDALPSELSEAR